jgi:putative acetyltransferase
MTLAAGPPSAPARPPLLGSRGTKRRGTQMSEVGWFRRIRRYESGDAAAVADIFFRSVRVLGACHYSRCQVEAWAPSPPDSSVCHARCTDGRVTLVATDDFDLPPAYADLEAGGYIDHLYCAPEAAGTGAASAVCDALERMAREQGMSRIYTEASEGARRFLERRGFVTRQPRDCRLRDVPIHNYSMEKTLASQPRPAVCNAPR